MEEGESFADFVGPLGRFELIDGTDELKEQTFPFVAGGLGTLLPSSVKYLHGRGKRLMC